MRTTGGFDRRHLRLMVLYCTSLHFSALYVLLVLRVTEVDGTRRPAFASVAMIGSARHCVPVIGPG
jgi:hypothetical protein